MKYLLMLVCLCALGIANAQTAFLHTASNPTGAVVNTGVDTMTVDFPSWNVAVGIQPLLTKNSGTITDVKSYLYGSINGTNFATTALDSMTSSNQSKNTIIWKLSTPVYRKYRIITTGSGTMNATTSAVITGLKN